MKNFILGIIATLGGLAVCNKIYDKGYDEAIKDSKKKEEKSSKDKKAK